MLAFVTGATGFLGSHVARVLAERGAELRLLVRPSSDLRNIEGLKAKPRGRGLAGPGFDREGDVGMQHGISRSS